MRKKETNRSKSVLAPVDSALGLLDWAGKYLPEHFTHPPSAMHIWLAAQLDAVGDRRGAKINLIGPRGSAKSTVATLAYVLQMAALGREKYIWIVSDTAPQACAHLENVALELTHNDRLIEAYEVEKGNPWRQNRIVLSGGVTLEALSTGQRIRGRRRHASRPTLIVADDLQNERDIESAVRRRKSRDWFYGALLPAGTPGTNVIHLATALHREAIALELSRTAGWISKTFPSILSWPTNMDLWRRWEEIYCNWDDPERLWFSREFYERRRAELEAGAEVLWPEVEDLYTLMCLRVDAGQTAFAREKQSSPINPDLCEWPEEYFAEHIWFEDWPTMLRVKAMALDPSKGGQDKVGDYSAIVWVGVDRAGLMYAQADLARRPTPQMVGDTVARYREFRPDGLAIETNSFQELLAGEVMAEFRRQNVLGAGVTQMENPECKRVRIRRLGPLLSARRLRFKAACPSTRLLVDQCRDFPLGAHDDGPDALEMAIRLAGQLAAGRRPVDNLGSEIPLTF
jgi:predicted phage terminase large subunit-like protein